MCLLELEEQFERIAEDIAEKTNLDCNHFGMGVFGLFDDQLGLLKRKVFEVNVNLFITAISCKSSSGYLIVNFDFK